MLAVNTSLVYYHLLDVLNASFFVGINVADIYGHRKICPGDCLKHQNFTTLPKSLHCSFMIVHWHVSITLFSCTPIKGLQNTSRV